MRKVFQTIAAACFCGTAICAGLHIGDAEAAAPKTVCDRYLSGGEDAQAFFREVEPEAIIKRMEIIMPACKDALKKYPRDGRVHALMARLHAARNEAALSFHHAKTSAELGYPYGALLMGLVYVHGAGVKRDFPESVRWWKKSAELGSPFAMDRVAKAYIHGQGVDKDPDAALGWFAKAARAGLKRAFLSLGYIHATGMTGKPHFRYALIYYTEARMLGVKGAEAQIKSLKKEARKAGRHEKSSPFNELGDLWQYEWFWRGADKNRETVQKRELYMKSNPPTVIYGLAAAASGRDDGKTRKILKKRKELIEAARKRGNVKLIPKRELTPEGWDWYERRFVSKGKQ